MPKEKKGVRLISGADAGSGQIITPTSRGSARGGVLGSFSARLLPKAGRARFNLPSRAHW
ncbi:hypothetical protein HYZ80_03120 [Candidatus Parcubacteria bacterium]|nr:hypothetical protein [Candidatus Parcubacteria bacterium]